LSEVAMDFSQNIIFSWIVIVAYCAGV